MCISYLIYYNIGNNFNQKINKMHRLVVNGSKFSTVLQILHRNKIQLKSINKTQISVPRENLQQLKNIRVNTLPYMNINYEYIRHNYLELSHQFSQLNVYANKLLPNQVLANGQQFQDYPLQKLINICLKYVKDDMKDKMMWGRLEKRINLVMRDTSPIDNITLLYISTNRWSKQFRRLIIGNINAQIKLMSQLQHQFLFYTICQVLQEIKNSSQQNGQQISKLNKIKEWMLSNVKKSKFNISILIQWILLISITNAPYVNVQSALIYFDKLHTCNNTMTIQHFYTLLVCLQSRAILAEQYQLNLLRNKGKNLTQLFFSKVSNSQIMVRGMKDKQQLRMKLILSYYNPQKVQNRLTNQQLLGNLLEPRQIIRYMYWIWKNNLTQHYQLKSLYSAISAQLDMQSNGKQPFKFIDYVYYCCWLQMAVDEYRKYKDIIIICNSMQYIPKGLQWPLWNYLGKITKNKIELTSQQKQHIQCIVKKIKDIDKKRQKSQKIEQEKNRIKNSSQIKQICKFFHQIKLWNWKISQPIASLDYIVHFINYQMKIIINCISYVHYCQPYSTNQINNEHLLNKILLKQNFGFAVLDVHVGNFMQLNYNDRIQWLRDNIAPLTTKTAAQLPNQ